MGMNELASVRICVLDDVVGFINVNSRVVVFEFELVLLFSEDGLFRIIKLRLVVAVVVVVDGTTVVIS